MGGAITVTPTNLFPPPGTLKEVQSKTTSFAVNAASAWAKFAAIVGFTVTEKYLLKLYDIFI